MTIKFSKKYKPLFEILEGKHPEVDTVIVTGGRGSAKSFVLSCFSLIALVYHFWNVLYTRFTNVSIVDSIKPEVDDKIELLGLSNYVTSTNTHIESKGNRIAFKGIKTGSKQQTANLKSLFGFNCFVVDEAEELPDYETYEKVFLSIRAKDKQNLTILILNPASVHHWIYRHFFTGKNVDAGSNTIKDNVCYIHTSYKDVEREYLADNVVAYYENLKETDEKKYNSVVLGGWTEAVEGRVFNNWKRNTYQEFLNIPLRSFYGVDWGKNHKFGIVELKYDRYTNTLYCHQRNYFSENELISKLNDTERLSINSNGGIIIHTFNKLGIDKDAIIVCDSARPDNIKLLRSYGWEYSVGIDKPKGSVMAGITLLQSTNVIYTQESDGIDTEFKNYSYANDRLGVVDDEVIKAYDDCFVASTPILTKTGYKPIIKMKKGDLVLTSNGYKKVLHKFNNGTKIISDYSIQFDTFSLSLSVTDNHLIKTTKGWIKISKLKSGMTIYHTNISKEESINYTKEENTLCSTNTTCITWFGNITKVKEKLSTIFITLMETLLITKSKILKRLTEKSIALCMQKTDLKITLNGLRNFTKRVLNPLKNGMHQKRGLSNTENKLLSQDLDCKHGEKENVNVVEKCLKQKRKTHTKSVLINANQSLEETAVLMTKKENVLNAEKSLKQINIQKLKIVALNVANRREEKTYDLMVDETHEYFANNILVHNCIDPIRYGRRYAEKHNL